MNSIPAEAVGGFARIRLLVDAETDRCFYKVRI